MVTKARAAVQVADRKYEIQEFALPTIESDSALMRVACGLSSLGSTRWSGCIRTPSVWKA
ncbi:hypothetical protein [Rhodococcus artemisiae]|uniref:Uncharacterized protein n=1 Tax=Rhodococcus artemisiae TaxID=714159 RepID=A0ABU7LKB8_9NOCA|nr:hypothetical protein [Rhodococcus artemisiae]MEE2062004.1 hypothetical protein [Rhodococcus artemisiae]